MPSVLRKMSRRRAPRAIRIPISRVCSDRVGDDAGDAEHHQDHADAANAPKMATPSRARVGVAAENAGRESESTIARPRSIDQSAASSLRGRRGESARAQQERAIVAFPSRTGRRPRHGRFCTPWFRVSAATPTISSRRPGRTRCARAPREHGASERLAPWVSVREGAVHHGHARASARRRGRGHGPPGSARRASGVVPRSDGRARQTSGASHPDVVVFPKIAEERRAVVVEAETTPGTARRGRAPHAGTSCAAAVR